MKIVIIGNGIAGTNAARFIRKWSDHEIVMISGETTYPFSRTALMYVYMGHLKLEHTKLYEDDFWAKNRIQLRKNWVKHIDCGQKLVLLEDGTEITYDKLILATGSKSNKFGWEGQELEGVQGLYHLQDLEQMERLSRAGIDRAVIVGGGLIGIEMAEMFHSRHIPVTFLVREKSFWDNILPQEESQMINQHIEKHGIDLRLSTELKSIHGKENKVDFVLTNNGEKIPSQFVGLTVGVSPNIEFVKNSGIATNRGIVVDEWLQTSDPDVYAIGDCAELSQPPSGRRSIEAIWYTGRMMGQTVAYSICKSAQKYAPGIWFNSAKFFDIEYQVYGSITPNLEADHSTIYWQHPTENKAIRVNYHAKGKHVTGFNLMGIRYRHEVCEKWIKEKASIENVLQHLSLANFDPEFFETYEGALVQQYNQLNGTKLQLRAEKGLNKVTRFLKSIAQNN